VRWGGAPRQGHPGLGEGEGEGPLLGCWERLICREEVPALWDGPPCLLALEPVLLIGGLPHPLQPVLSQRLQSGSHGPHSQGAKGYAICAPPPVAVH
jgi:hypothetical protein